jgi:ubiquitin-protein ligase
MLPRLRRLQSDSETVTRLFANHPRIRLVSTDGQPPDRYQFLVQVSGLAPEGAAGFRAIQEHRIEVYLPADYPRRPPVCRMLSPVYHPNIDPQKICIGDHWSAGQSVAQLVVRIAEMICFQSYNLKSPLNAAAAAWAEKNLDRLPLERVDLAAGL